MTKVWHYSTNGQRHGPVTAAELKDLAAAGRLSPGDKVWKEGMEKWVPARTVKGLFAQAADAGEASTQVGVKGDRPRPASRPPGEALGHPRGEAEDDDPPATRRPRSPALTLGIIGGGVACLLLVGVVVVVLLTRGGQGDSGNQGADGKGGQVNGEDKPDGGANTGRQGQEARVLDKPVLSMKWPGGGGPDSVAFAPDGKRLLAISQNAPFYELYGLDEGKALPKGGMLLPGTRVRKRVKQDFGGDLSATLFPDDQIVRFLLDDDKEDFQYKVSRVFLEGNREAGRGGRPILSPDGRFLLVDRQSQSTTLGGKGDLAVYDTEGGEVRLADAAVQDLTPVGPRRYAFSPDGNLLVLSTKAGVKAWDLSEARKGGHRARLATTLRPETVLLLCQFSGDGKVLALGWRDTKASQVVVQVLDASSWKPAGSIEVKTGRNPGRHFSSDGRTVAVTWQEDRTGADGKKYTGWVVVLLDVATGKEIHRIESDNADQVLFTADGKTLVLGCQLFGGGDPSHVDLYDVGTGRKTVRIVGRRFRCFAVSADGDRVATGSKDNTVQVWNVRD